MIWKVGSRIKRHVKAKVVQVEIGKAFEKEDIIMRG